MLGSGTYQRSSSDEPSTADDEDDGRDSLVGDEASPGLGDGAAETRSEVDENDSKDYESRDGDRRNEAFDCSEESANGWSVQS